MIGALLYLVYYVGAMGNIRTPFYNEPDGDNVVGKHTYIILLVLPYVVVEQRPKKLLNTKYFYVCRNL